MDKNLIKNVAEETIVDTAEWCEVIARTDLNTRDK